MEADGSADEARRQDVALDELADPEDHRDDHGKLPARPGLHQRHPDGDEEAEDRADERDEGDEAGGEADERPEAQAHQAQRHAVEQAEEKADERLAAHKARNGTVDIAGDLPDGRRMLAGQPGIDLRDHVVPVEQDVEGHHGRDDQDADQAEDGLPAAPQRGEEAADDRRSLSERIRERLLDVGKAVADESSEPALAEIGEDPLQGRTIIRQALAEARDLIAEDGDEQHEADHQQHDKSKKDDRDRRPAPKAEPLQSVGHRVEEIGEHQARDEGQQHAAEQPDKQHEDDERREPEGDLPLKCHRCPLAEPAIGPSKMGR
jgi:hypothetical protein